MDSKIRIFDENGVLGSTLEGHSKGIISFSWTTTGQLISGSWDGTAKIWDLETNSCVQTLQPHENGVHVLGLSNSLVATTSTGESVDGKPANFKLRIWDPATGREVGAPITDHSGSIRAIASIPGINGFATSANDGTMALRSIDGELLGTVYLDLYMRPNKFQGAAHFTILCGCNKFDTTHIQQHSAAPVPIEEVQQLPSVALVFNFNSGRSAGKPSEAQTLLTLSDVETLHHEWGHALHSLLSRTAFQHLSGTRGGVDLIEVPSHLLEYFARSPEVIARWARHHRTGEAPPLELLKDALSYRGEFGAIELQNQVLFSAVDQVRHFQCLFFCLLSDGVCGAVPVRVWHRRRVCIV